LSHLGIHQLFGEDAFHCGPNIAKISLDDGHSRSVTLGQQKGGRDPCQYTDHQTDCQQFKERNAGVSGEFAFDWRVEAASCPVHALTFRFGFSRLIGISAVSLHVWFIAGRSTQSQCIAYRQAVSRSGRKQRRIGPWGSMVRSGWGDFVVSEWATAGSTTSHGEVDRVLIVEDDSDVAALLERVIAMGGMHSERAGCLADLRAMPIRGLQLVILDLTLPDGDGLEALRELRRDSDIPVIVLSGRAAEAERVRAFDSGANDYVVKPFLAQELLARIRSHLRTARRSEVPVGTRVSIDSGTLTASVDGRPVDLTPREFDLLAYLFERRHRVCRRDELLAAIWRTEFLDPAALNEYVYRLRARLREAGADNVIRTRRGIGYKFDDASGVTS
jgi:two-component system response regulator RegX3